MRQRCNNPNHTAARWYHDRGITVCDEWLRSYEAFEKWALSHGYTDEMTIDRIDPDGNYCPVNCQWITKRDNIAKARRPGEVTQIRVKREKPKPKQEHNFYFSALTEKEIQLITNLAALPPDLQAKAKEIADKIKQLPSSAENYIRGYMQGVSDMAKDAPKKETP